MAAMGDMRSVQSQGGTRARAGIEAQAASELHLSSIPLNPRQRAVLSMQQTSGNASVRRYLSELTGRRELLRRYPAAPPNSPYTNIPAALLQTIQDSLDDRRNLHMTGADGYLNWFPNMDTATTVWEALDRMPPSIIDMMVEIHQRVVNSGLSWSFFSRILNSWVGTSRGYRFLCPNPGGLRTALTGNTHFCRDRSRISAIWHDGDCWREALPGGATDHGLHICLVSGNIQSLHIDMHMPVDSRDAQGECNFNYTTGVPSHAADILLHANPMNIYESQADALSDIAKLRQDNASDAALVARLNGYENRLKAIEPGLRQLASRTTERTNASEAADYNTPEGREIQDIRHQLALIHMQTDPPSYDVGF